MNVGYLILALGISILYFSFTVNEYLITCWIGLSFFFVGIMYFVGYPKIFKKNNGKLKMLRVILLFPFFISTWITWHLYRIFKKENPYDQILDNIYVGRRLLSSEFSSKFDIVVDLTSEFSESQLIASKKYYLLQTLDASVPKINDLLDIVKIIINTDQNIYIHCAQGHGRAGLFAASILLAKGIVSNLDDAINFLQSKRPGISLKRNQYNFLQSNVDKLINLSKKII